MPCARFFIKIETRVHNVRYNHWVSMFIHDARNLLYQYDMICSGIVMCTFRDMWTEVPWERLMGGFTARIKLMVKIT